MDKEGNNSSSSSLISDIKPSFYRLVLVDRTLINRHLLIPPEFMKYIPDELGENAILSVPSGRHWHIELQKTEKGVYLQNGWTKFFKDNSLGDKEFLHFTYDGNMCFDVKIYDKNGCERAYECDVTNGGSVIHTEKRKRGRPRKIVKKSDSISGRRRGRPRKDFGITTCVDGSEPDNEQPPPWVSSERPLELD